MIVLFGAKIFKQNKKGKNENKIRQRKTTIIYKKKKRKKYSSFKEDGEGVILWPI